MFAVVFLNVYFGGGISRDMSPSKKKRTYPWKYVPRKTVVLLFSFMRKRTKKNQFTPKFFSFFSTEKKIKIRHNPPFFAMCFYSNILVIKM